MDPDQTAPTETSKTDDKTDEMLQLMLYGLIVDQPGDNFLFYAQLN